MARRPPLSLPVVAASTPVPLPIQMRTPARQGKRAVAFWIDAADYEEFQVATIRAKTTIQAAGVAMLADWMRGQGMKMPGRG